MKEKRYKPEEGENAEGRQDEGKTTGKNGRGREKGGTTGEAREKEGRRRVG
jgi:hypothetical protein